MVITGIKKVNWNAIKANLKVNAIKAKCKLIHASGN